MCVERVDDIAYRVQLAHDPPMGEREWILDAGPGREDKSVENLLQLKPPEPGGGGFDVDIVTVK